MATAFGGLWKTVNRGLSFQPIFDEGPSFTLCCVVVDPRNPNVVWLGTGENHRQRSAHFGDGVYKSTDAGKTWKRVGLENSEHIGKIIIDPRNSNTVYVAVQGPLFSAGGERGVYKTMDGGAPWTRSLHINDDTGVTDIVFDPKNPDILFAGSYQRRRHVGQMIGGGPDGGVFKTTDGGKTCTKLTKGLHPGEVERIQPALAEYRGPEVAPGVAAGDDLRPHVRRHATTFYHPVGTCRMGRDPLAVVDHELRVHGVAGLRVVDASVMPTLVGGATHAAAVMIGEKGASLVKKGLVTPA